MSDDRPRCPVRSILGVQCVHPAHHELEHAYLHGDLSGELTAAKAERDDARRELAILRTTLAMDAKHADESHEQQSSAFWFTQWTEANRRGAEMSLELERLRRGVVKLIAAWDAPTEDLAARLRAIDALRKAVT